MGRANDMRCVARKAGVSLAVVIAAGLGTVPLSPVFASETGSEVAVDVLAGDEATDQDVAKVDNQSFKTLQDAVDAALKDDNRGTVDLLDDFSLTQCINVPEDAILHINGNGKTITLESKGGLPAFGNTGVSTNGIYGSTKLSIHGVNFITPSTLSDVEVSQQNYAVLVSGQASGVEVTFDKCSFTNMHDAVYCNSVKDEAAEQNSITIKNSKFDNTVYVYGCEDGYASGDRTDKHAFTVENCIDEEGYPFTVVETQAVASVDGVGYKDLSTAIVAAGNAETDKTVTLCKDVALDKMLTISTPDVILDLDGHTISASEEFIGTDKNKQHLVDVLAYGVKIKDGSLVAGAGNNHTLNIWGAEKVTLENVVLDNANAGYGGAPLVIGGSDVTVNDALTTVTGENSWYAINVDTKTIGGTLTSASFDVADGATVTLKGEKPEYNEGIVVENGAKATGSTVSFDGGSQLNVEIDSDGFVAAKTTGSNSSITLPNGFTIKDDAVFSEAVASVVNNGDTEDYSSFAEAVAEAQTNGGTVQLLKDVTIDKTIEIKKNVTIDGGDHTVTADGCVGFYIKDNLDCLAISNLILKGTPDADGIAGEGGSGSFMGIGTYNGCYGVANLDLDNVTIEGFSYGMYFGQNPTGNTNPININPVKVDADNLTIKDCYIKGAYFEKLTESTFTGCSFLNNGDNEDQVEQNFRTWMCGVDINLKNGEYKDIVFDGCKFTGNGENEGTALHIKARDDGDYGEDTKLDGVAVVNCTFENNNDVVLDDDVSTPIVIGEENKSNKTPVNVTITGDVAYKNNLAGEAQAFHTVTFNSDGKVISTISANGEIVLPAAPTKDGYTFLGWSDGEKTYSAGDSVAVDNVITFTAKWKRNSTGGSTGGGSVSKPDYAITVPEAEHGKVTVDPERAKAGEEVTVSAEPDEGFEVASVTVTGKDGKAVEVTESADGTWTFEMPKGGATVEVAFACDGGELCPTAGLADVDQSKWYHLAVDWAVETGLMEGYEGTELFGPGDPLTRAQLAQMLYNRAGAPEAEAEEGFADVDAADWFAPAVAWASSEGLITGYGEGAFGPDDALTREQLAVVFWRMAGEPAAEADLSGFPDGAETSAWAVEAMRWAVSTGLLEGYTDTGRLDPTGDFTRAQAATVFFRQAEAE